MSFSGLVLAFVLEKEQGSGEFRFEEVRVGLELESGEATAAVGLFEIGSDRRELSFAELLRSEVDGLVGVGIEGVENIADRFLASIVEAAALPLYCKRVVFSASFLRNENESA